MFSLLTQSPSGLQVMAKTQKLEKALELLKKNKADVLMMDSHTAKMLISQVLQKTAVSRTEVSARTRQGIQLIPIQDIYYFQADQKYVTVYYEGGSILIEDTLNDLAIEFREKFVRIHRAFLVNLQAIQDLKKDEKGHFWLGLRSLPITLPVSRRQVAQLRKRLP